MTAPPLRFPVALPSTAGACRLLAVTVITACATACTTARPSFRPPAVCDATRLQAAAPYHASQWRSLEGVFRIYEIDTVNGSVTEVERLELAVPDSATRALFIGPRNKIGRGVVVLDSTPYPVPQLVGVVLIGQERKVNFSWRLHEDRSLTHACPTFSLCNDDSPTSYLVTHHSAAGFFGEWSNPMIGIARLYDPATDRELPPPEGYFCAIRRSDDQGSP